MSILGLGYRIAADVLFEISLHLCQPAVYQALTANVAAGNAQTASVSSTYAMYAGCLLVVEVAGNANIEVITVISVLSATQFTANFANAHSIGAPVWGPTFPTQGGTDPIFTQSEMLQYLSRAQNEFLTAVPCNYARFFQNLTQNVVYQSLPSTAILVDRVAAATTILPIASLVRNNNTVTMTTVYPHGLSQYSTFGVYDYYTTLTNNSFLGGAFAVNAVPSSPTTLTYVQVGANASATGGSLQSMLRLYELTQEELTMQGRAWQSNIISAPRNWFEDRSGLYKWGVGGRPSSAFPVELLCAVRDTDTLSLIDGFLVPDVVCHALKYLALSYIWSKEGIASQPALAEFCMQRYYRIVLATQRYIQAMKMEVGK